MAISGYEIVSNESAPAVITPGNSAKVDVAAPSGKTVLGGGYLVDLPTESFIVGGSYPTDNGETWRVRIKNTDTSNIEVAVWAICADA
jgi:hypothetical protein